MQILHAIEKSGHTTKNPKLRGIAITPLLCRLYDIIIDERFCAWYKPNYEQAGFRPRQGCLLQIFMMFVLICYSKEYNKDLYMGLMDYTKAFDYTNRAKLVSNLMEKVVENCLYKLLPRCLINLCIILNYLETE